MSDKQLPDGIEWPRFEDGVPIAIGDEIYIPSTGVSERVDAIRFDKEYTYCTTGFGNEYIYPLNKPARRPPVLDKDGKEIKVGDTVCDTQGTQFVVESINRCGADRPLCECIYKYEGCAARVHKNPCILTHTPPDSWEKLREDVKRIDEHASMCAYEESEGRECKDCSANEYADCSIYVIQDIFYRAEKLAGVSADD